MQPIADVLIEDILSRFPVKDLLRFKCVCKSWKTLINNPDFILMHYNLHHALHKSQGTMPLFLWRYLSDRHPVDTSMCHLLSKRNGDDVMVEMTVDLERDTKLALNYSGDFIEACFLACVGIANGIVCLQLNSDSINQCGLWNPSIRELKILPDVGDSDQVKPPSMTVVCVVFDGLCNDFKVVAHVFIEFDGMSYPVEFFNESKGISSAYEVYSLSTDSWKRLPYLGETIYPSDMDACLNGVYYWTVRKENSSLMFSIVSFNFSIEVFKVSDPSQCVALPLGWLAKKYYHRIGLYKDYLALIFTHRRLNEALADVSHVAIWVATKFDDEGFGVPLEWQCLLVVEPFSTSPKTFPVMSTRMDGQLLLKTSDVEPKNGE